MFFREFDGRRKHGVSELHCVVDCCSVAECKGTKLAPDEADAAATTTTAATTTRERNGVAQVESIQLSQVCF